MAVAAPPKLVLGEQIVALGARSASLNYQLVHLCARFEESNEWALQGAVTAAHWIAEALDVEVCTAREWVRMGRALRGLPLLDAAFEAGELSFTKVRALTRVATADNEAALRDMAMRVPASRLNVALANWLRSTESPEETDERHHRQRGLWWRNEPDGTVSGGFNLPPVQAGKLAAAIDAMVMRANASAHATAVASAGERPTLAQQRADALIGLLDGGGPAVETEVIVHVRGDGCSLDDGMPVTDSAVAALIPDSVLRAMIHDAEAHPINVSGRHRHPTDRQKRVVRERDRGCVDCGGRTFLEYDHVPDYDISKRTLVEELELRCSGCHRRRHKKGWAGRAP